MVCVRGPERGVLLRSRQTRFGRVVKTQDRGQDLKRFQYHFDHVLIAQHLRGIDRVFGNDEDVHGFAIHHDLTFDASASYVTVDEGVDSRFSITRDTSSADSNTF